MGWGWGEGEFWSKSVPFTPVAHFRPVSPVQAEKDLWGGTIWQDAVCHVGYLALPTCEWPDASQPSPLSLLGLNGTGYHRNGWLVAAVVMKRKGGVRQVFETHKSCKSRRLKCFLFFFATYRPTSFFSFFFCRCSSLFFNLTKICQASSKCHFYEYRSLIRIWCDKNHTDIIMMSGPLFN